MSTQVLITAVFDSGAAAGRALDTLLESGVARDTITVLLSDEVHQELANQRAATGSEPASNQLTRATKTGALVGGTLTALMGTAISLSGLGLVGIGPFAALLGGGAVGATAGGLVGSLIGIGIRDDLARAYEKGIGKGGLLIGVSCAEKEARWIEDLLTAQDGRDVARVERGG